VTDRRVVPAVTHDAAQDVLGPEIDPADVAVCLLLDDAQDINIYQQIERQARPATHAPTVIALPGFGPMVH